jgi:hypothetical protein
MRTEQPSWEDIYGARIPRDLPPVPKNVTPVVDNPECPRDCSGRHGVDAEMRCNSCQAVAYVDWWHEYRVNRGVNFHRLQTVNGAPVLIFAHMPCPVCGGQFRK